MWRPLIDPRKSLTTEWIRPMEDNKKISMWHNQDEEEQQQHRLSESNGSCMNCIISDEATISTEEWSIS